MIDDSKFSSDSSRNYDDGFNSSAEVIAATHTAEAGFSTLDPSLKGSITAKLMSFATGPGLDKNKTEIAGLLHDFFSLPLQERTATEHKAWVVKILTALEIDAQIFSFITDKQYADYAFALAKFIQERQHMIQAPKQQSSPSILSADPTAFCVGDPLASLDRRVGGMALHDGVLAQPPRNRRSTDPKTPPTQTLVHTNTVEAKGLRALLQSFLSKIMPTKPD